MNDTKKFVFKTFLALIVGFIILIISASFIMGAYLRLTRSSLTPQRISHNIVRMIKLARTLPPKQAPKTFRYVRSPGVWVSFSRIEKAEFMPIFSVDFNAIQKQVLKNPNHVNLTYPLSDSYYMHFRTRIVRPLTLKLQFFAALLVWLAALVIFCYLIVRQLSLPLIMFIKGANRFAHDINAPPIPEVGPKSSKEALHAFNKMQSNLKQLIQNRTQMLAAVSHDLKTPITRLSLRVENLPDSKTTEKIQSDIKQMQTMIDSILAFAELDVYNEAVSQINIDAFMQTICDDMRDASNNVNYHDFDEKVIILGRPLALRRAFENIINNGIKFGKKVDVNLLKKNDTLLIIISDQGPGIPNIELEKVFLPFYKVDKARTDENAGSGLGLATAKDIIQTHGGQIKLSNIKPHGLQVSIHFSLWF